MIPRSDYTDAAERELPHWQGVTWRYACAAKHNRIVVSFNGAQRFVVFPTSGSDSRRGARAFIADLRGELRGMGAERDAPAKSPTRGRPRKSAPSRPAALPEITDPRPDGFAALRELQQRMQETTRPRPEPEWWARARVLRESGLSEQTIAGLIGVTRSGVARALHPERYQKYAVVPSGASRARRIKRWRGRLGEWADKHGFQLTDDAILDFVKTLNRAKRPAQESAAQEQAA